MKRGADPRRRFLEQIGVGVPTRPLNVAEEEQAAERLKHQEMIHSCLGQPIVSVQDIRETMRHGTITKSRDRFLCWELVLNVKPAARELWDFEDKQRRTWYHDVTRAAQCVLGRSGADWTRLKEDGMDEVAADIAASLVKQLRVHRMAVESSGWDRGRTLNAVEGEFDLLAIASTFASALEVEFMGGPGTFWCLESFVENHLVAGGAHALARLAMKLLSAADELLYAHLCFLGVCVSDAALSWHRRLFAGVFPRDTVISIMDAVLVYGLPFASFIGSALLQSTRQRLLGCGTLQDALAIFLPGSQDPHSAHVLSSAHSAWSSHQFDSVRSDCSGLPPFPQYFAHLDAMMRDALSLADLPFSKYASVSQSSDGTHFTGRIDGFNPEWATPITVMGTLVPGVTPTALVGTLCSPTPVARVSVDHSLDSLTVIQRLAKNVWVMLERTKGVANIVSPRELLVVMTSVSLSRGRRLMVSRSVTHPSCPEEGGGRINRGIVHISAYLFAPVACPCACLKAASGQAGAALTMSDDEHDASSQAMAASTGTFLATTSRKSLHHSYGAGGVYPKHRPASEGVQWEGLEGGGALGTTAKTFALVFQAIDLKGMLPQAASVRMSSDMMAGVASVWKKRYSEHPPQGGGH